MTATEKPHRTSENEAILSNVALLTFSYVWVRVRVGVKPNQRVKCRVCKKATLDKKAENVQSKEIINYSTSIMFLY